MLLRNASTTTPARGLREVVALLVAVRTARARTQSEEQADVARMLAQGSRLREASIQLREEGRAAVLESRQAASCMAETIARAADRLALSRRSLPEVAPAPRNFASR